MDQRHRNLGFAARLVTRRPWTVVAVWGVVVCLLGVAGLPAKRVLKPEDLVIRGTPSAQAVQKERAAFGPSSPLVVLLEGPAGQLDKYGPQVARSLRGIRDVTVSDPWSPGAPAFLRKTPNTALLMVEIHRSLFAAGRETVPQIQRTLHAQLPPDVESHVAGEARFSTELVDLVFSGAQRAELIALPFLLIVLLLIFRAPIAAGLPLVQGVAVIALTTGIVTLLGRAMPVNVLAQASGSIIGLALGVDYSLLMVSRFRDELAAGRSPTDAVGATMATAGRTVFFAGTILVLAGLVVIAVSFGWASMATGSIGVISAAVFSVLAAFTLLPACLFLLGENVNRWAIGAVRPRSSLGALVARLIDHPVLVSALALVPLLALGAFALTLKTGGPDPSVFRADNAMRSDVDAVARVYGGGVMAPYEVIASTGDGPVTAPKTIRSLVAFQSGLAADPQVRYVVGPGVESISRVSDAASNGPRQLAYGLTAASTAAGRLDKGVGAGASGARQLAGANSSAAGGAQQLAGGLASASSGASALASGLGSSASGSKELSSAVDRLSRGASELRTAMKGASSDTAALINGTKTLQGQISTANNDLAALDPASGSAGKSLDQALAAIDGLDPSVKSDPSVQSARSAISSARANVNTDFSSVMQQYRTIAGNIDTGNTQVKNASGQIDRLGNAISKLSGGLSQAASGSDELSGGLSKLSSGGGQLENGMAPLAQGASTLASGLSTTSGGSAQLSSGLSKGKRGSHKLARGLRDVKGALSKGNGVDLKSFGQSPYLTMALLGAVPAAEKRNLQFVLNEQNGGSAARVFLFTEDYPTNKSIGGFADRLSTDAGALSKKTGVSVAVGGQGQTFHDYDKFTHSRVLPLILAMSLMSFLFLLLVFRSPLLAFEAVVLNLVTVGASMGVIRLLYGGDDPLFGGPGWIEATSFFVIFSTTFALSMDYEIFMINRMREIYVRTGSNREAITEGVARTAGVVTGSAAVMSILFISMALASRLVSNAQLGVGLAVAILIDATIVRLVLLPASMRLFGEANWWLPSWLDRLLPNVAID